MPSLQVVVGPGSILHEHVPRGVRIFESRHLAPCLVRINSTWLILISSALFRAEFMLFLYLMIHIIMLLPDKCKEKTQLVADKVTTLLDKT